MSILRVRKKSKFISFAKLQKKKFFKNYHNCGIFEKLIILLSGNTENVQFSLPTCILKIDSKWQVKEYIVFQRNHDSKYFPKLEMPVQNLHEFAYAIPSSNTKEKNFQFLISKFDLCLKYKMIYIP